MPLVSVVTPTYNCGRFIGRTIESVLRQKVTDWEMIIVDDCSLDDTRQVVERYADPRIRYVALETNSGAAVARTEAIALAEGRYIAFLDSDDLWCEDKLERQIRFMEENGFNFTCTDYEQINEDGTPAGKTIRAKKKTDYNGVLLTCPVGNSSVMYNAEKLGKFVVPNIRKRNDDALWLQILKKEKYIFGLPEVLMQYRLREGSLSGKKLALVKYHWKLYREIERLSVPRSVFHICCWGVIKLLGIK